MENVQYLIAEEEYGEKNGTRHIQGYIRFNKKLYRSTIRSWYSPRRRDNFNGTITKSERGIQS